jgi:uncharacterized repeat protein (TIGR01451 family)
MSHAWSGSFRTLLPWQCKAVTRLEPRLSRDATGEDGSRSSRGTPRKTLISVISNLSHAADTSRATVPNRILLGGLMKTYRGSASVSFFCHVLALLGLLVWHGSLLAVTTLTVTPITWNTVGLDSNNVSVGPNDFPIGVRVCNTGGATASGVQASFVWDSTNTYINLRPGTAGSGSPGAPSTLSVASLSAGACTDFYFEVEVTRNALAYDTTRNYHIALTADSGATTASSPVPRQLYVEHLISQSRNHVIDIKYALTGFSRVSVPAGGMLTLIKGQTYDIELDSTTATNGYEQLETFMNLPNTIFQVISVASTYTAYSGVDLTRLYADGCGWVNDPNDPNYRSCTGTGKNGGTITTIYTVTILSAPSSPLTNPEPLTSLVYDFSGSSFHYNSDSGASVRYAYIPDPTATTFSKSFSPKPAAPGGVSALTFTIGNPTPVAISSVNFVDNLPTSPGIMVVATPNGLTTPSGCSPTITATAGTGSITVTNATIAAYGTCSFAVNVKTPSTPTSGTYANTSDHLFIGSTDTTKFATDSLTVQSIGAVACTPGMQLAQWTMAPAVPNPLPPVYNTKSTTPLVSSALATFVGTSSSINTTTGSAAVNSWSGVGPWTGIAANFPNSAAPYFQFTLDTSNFSGGTGVSISFSYNPVGPSDWGGSSNNYVYVYSSADGAAFNPTLAIGTIAGATKNQWGTSASFTATATGSSTTTFRINVVGASNATAAFLLDDITFTGCGATAPANPPTLAKAFVTSPIPLNGTSVLTFTLTNPNVAGVAALTGVTFTDSLPSGVQVAATPNASTTCLGTPTWAPAAAATTLTFGSPAGATMAIGNTCTASVTVTGTTSGPHSNVSGYVSAFQSGSNTTATGYGTANLDVLAPPSIAKSFGAPAILTAATTPLTFTITNWNTGNSLTGVAFTDTLPTGLTVATSSSSQCGGTLTTTNPTTISLAGGSITASSSCTFNVTVTGTTGAAKPGVTYTNTTGAVTSTNGGTGNTASAQLVVTNTTPAIGILKQVGPTATGAWAASLVMPSVPTSVYFQFTVENKGDTNLGAMTITDSTYPGLNLSACTTALAGGIPLNDPPLQTRMRTCVAGPVAVSAAGSYTNSATASDGTTTSNISTVNFDTEALTLAKSVTQTSFAAAGNSLNYSYLVTNTGFYPLLGPVTVTDNKVSVTCPAVSTVGDLDNYLDPGEAITCTATYTVLAGDMSAGYVTNVASATAGGITSNFATRTVLKTGLPLNFGHLPVGGACPACFPAGSTNLSASGGAQAVTGNSYLGSIVQNSLSGGPTNGTDASTFTPKASEDGVVPTPGFQWTPGGGAGSGSVDVTVTCPAAPCYLSAWINWQQDGNINGAGDQIFDAVPVVAGKQTLTFTVPSGTLTTGTYYARFRLYASQPSGTTLATGSATVGEIEDYGWLASSVTTAPVTLAYFQAHQQGHGFHIEWSTATEAGNVGFALYTSSGAKPDKLVKITQQPVRSTAKDPVSPQDYVFDTTSDAPSGIFYLEDLDVYGSGRMHGPFTAGRPYGRKPKPVKTDWAAIHKEHDKHQRDQDAAALAAMAARGSNATRANLLVSADGVYRVTYEALLAAGFNFGGVMAKDLALFNKGGSVPIEVTGSGPTFGAGSAIQFYGEALNTIYTYNNVYTLQVDKANALRVANDDTKPGLATPTASYMETVKVNNNVNYDLGSTSGDPWYDTTLFTYSSPAPASFPITIDNVSSTSGASLTVDFYGVTDFPLSPDHHVIVQLNGTTVSEKVFDGVANELVQAPLPQGLIHEGANSMTLILPGDTGADYDMVNLDRYSITYARRFLARAGRLTFTASGSVFQVGGLPTPNVLVYRLSGSTPVRLTGAQVQISGAGYAVSFLGNGQSATYAVTALEAAPTPPFSVPSSSSGVTTGPAQLLVISHPDFLDNLGPLVAARQAEGLSVKVVDVNDVYAQYTYGIFDPAAIKSYVKYAAANMGTQYVLLVGGDTYDYRNDLGIGAVGFIPTLYAATDNYVVYAPVDPLFGDVNGDNIPEVAIGRLPASTTAEVDSMIRKTLAYASKPYAKTAMFAADEDEPGVSYKVASEAFLASLPAGWVKQEANVGDIGGVDAARLAVINAMNSGVALVSFYGHGAPWMWTFSGLFNTDDAAALTNVGSPFFVSQLGCWNSYYVSPYYDSLGHVFLLAGDQGAAGVGGPAAMTVTTSDELFGKFLFPRLTAPGARVGAAIVGAKKDAVGASDPTTLVDILLGYVLLGDPTLRIQP